MQNEENYSEVIGRVTINFSDEPKSKDYIVLEPDCYVMEILEVKKTLRPAFGANDAQQGTPQLEWKFKISTENGETLIKDWTSLEKGKRWKLRNLLSSLGFTETNETMQVNFETLKGRKILGMIIKTEDAKPKNKIKQYAQFIENKNEENTSSF